MTEPNLSPACFTKYSEQTQSNIFSLLPPEIRYEIFVYALTSSPDTTQPPGQDVYCTRPGYETRHQTYTELLRTCKKSLHGSMVYALHLFGACILDGVLGPHSRANDYS
ncbi:hypothetical protein AAEP93_008425 [Penicillium crustosum]